MSKTQDLLESFPKFRIEDGVDEWVDAGVDVAQPGSDKEVPRLVLNGRGYILLGKNTGLHTKSGMGELSILPSTQNTDVLPRPGCVSVFGTFELKYQK